MEDAEALKAELTKVTEERDRLRWELESAIASLDRYGMASIRVEPAGHPGVLLSRMVAPTSSTADERARWGWSLPVTDEQEPDPPYFGVRFFTAEGRHECVNCTYDPETRVITPDDKRLAPVRLPIPGLSKP